MHVQKFLFVSAMLVVLLTPGAVAHAVVLEQSADVSVRNIIVSKVAERTFTVTFSISNNDTVPLRDIQYGIWFQDKEGARAYTYIAPTPTFSLSEKQSIDKSTTVTVPKSLSGTYTAILSVQNKSGTTLATSVSDTVKFPKSSESNPNFSCTLNTSNTLYTCSYALSGASVSYIVQGGGFLGKQVQKGKQVHIKKEKGKTNSAIINIQKMNLPNGRYSITAFLNTETKKLIAQQNALFVSPDGWMAIVGLTQKINVDGTFTMNLFLNGSGESTTRGFVYGVIDASKKLCASGKIDIQFSIPKKRTITSVLPATCNTPTAVGFLYDGTNTDGSYRIIDSFGGISPKQLLSERIKTVSSNSTLQRMYAWVQNNTGVVILIFVFILFLLAVGFRIIGKKGVLVGAIVVMTFLGAAPYAQASTFSTSDNTQTTFTVNMSKAKYYANENITFTFAITNAVGKKPVGAYVQAQVGAGTLSTIVASTSTQTTYSVIIPPTGVGGVQNLNFTVPGLCGSAFNYSVFGVSVFGSKNCTFSVPVTVIVNTAPPAPQVATKCVIGGSSTLSLTSQDPQGDRVFYQVDYKNGKPIVRVPASGYAPAYPTPGTTSYTGWNTQGSKTFSSRATDSIGAASAWNQNSAVCTPVCTASVVCDGAGSKTLLSAKPSIVVPGTKTRLYWNLANVRNCSIKGTNGDVFSTNLVSSVKSAKTGIIQKSTTYTIQCLDFNGKKVSGTTTVRLAPKWKEF